MSPSEWYEQWLKDALAVPSGPTGKLVILSAPASATYSSREPPKSQEELELERQRREAQKKVDRASRVMNAAVRANDLPGACTSAEELLELKAKLSTKLLREMLENASKSRKCEIFVRVLKCCIANGLLLDAREFARLLGIVLSRDASHAQVRVLLNMALDKGSTPIPLVPEELAFDERSSVFEEGKAGSTQEDGEAESGDEKHASERHKLGENSSLPEPMFFQKHDAFPELNGEYVATAPMPDVLEHSRHVFFKLGGLQFDSVDDAEELVAEDVYAYYWQDDPDQPWRTGWYIGTEVAGDEVFAYNPSDTDIPPRAGWQAIDGNSRYPDAAEFVTRTEAKKDKKVAPVDPEDVEQALSEVDLVDVQGMVGVVKSSNCIGSSREAVDYFRHFCVLLHLERLAELSRHRRRLLRWRPERLTQLGYALEGLKIQTTFDKKLPRKALLPGWPDCGSECVVFYMPWGADVERLRFKRGETVIVSRGEPLRNRLCDANIIDIDSWKLVLQLNHVLPEDAKQTTWRVDSYANKVVYQRQLLALMHIATVENLHPLCRMLVEAGVGHLDDWAEREKERMSLNRQGKRKAVAQLKNAGTKKQKTDEKTDEQAYEKSDDRVNDEQVEEKNDTDIAQAGDDKNKAITDKLETTSTCDKTLSSPAATATEESKCAVTAKFKLDDLYDKEKLQDAKDELLVDDRLNESQKSSIENALLQRCSVIQGPPGTGKTHVSVKLLQLLTKTLGVSPILATSDSNVAVDNIAEGLGKIGVRVVRVGRPEKTREHLEDICVDIILAREKDEKKQREKDKAEEDAAAAALAAKTAAQEAAALQAVEEERARLASESGILAADAADGGNVSGNLGSGIGGVDEWADDDDAWAEGSWALDDDVDANTEAKSEERALAEAKAAAAAADAEAAAAAAAGAAAASLAQQEASQLAQVAEAAAAKLEKLSSELENGVAKRKMNSAEMKLEYERRQKQRKEDRELRMKILKEADVICTTTMTAGGDIMKDFSFKAILIDEVAQATELSAIVPIVTRGARQLILVGDHCQLPPGVQSREAELRGLSLSIYSRLTSAGIKPYFLDTQYRSHRCIAEFSAQCFYQGQLKTGIEDSQRPAPIGVEWPNADVPVAFFEVAGHETLEGESKTNLEEVQVVLEFVTEVLKAGELGHEDIGVVTPYMAQVRALRKSLRAEAPGSNAEKRLLEIASVDNFQGREKELIIFSAVRNNRRGNVGFLADWRRLNVMLTRAKRGLVVFGNAKTLRHNCHWSQWLEWCHEHKAVTSRKAWKQDENNGNYDEHWSNTRKKWDGASGRKGRKWKHKGRRESTNDGEWKQGGRKENNTDGGWKQEGYTNDNDDGETEVLDPWKTLGFFKKDDDSEERRSPSPSPRRATDRKNEGGLDLEKVKPRPKAGWAAPRAPPLRPRPPSKPPPSSSAPWHRNHEDRESRPSGPSKRPLFCPSKKRARVEDEADNM